MSSRGTAIWAARHRSGRWVMAAPISRPPLLPPRMARSRPRGAAGVHQPVGRGDEVVEAPLLVLAHAGPVPGLALLGAAADVGHRVEPAVVAHRHDGRAVGRSHRDREAAVAGEHAGRVRAGHGAGRPGSGTSGSRCRRPTGSAPARPRSRPGVRRGPVAVGPGRSARLQSVSSPDPVGWAASGTASAVGRTR